MCAMEPQQRQGLKQCRWSGKECTMCGDVGFQNQLFRCTSCRQRYQHRYCSSFYPHVSGDGSQLVCDWCISRLRDKPRSTGVKEEEEEEEPCSSMTGKCSPLDCLLQVAESICERQQQQGALPGVKKCGVKMNTPPGDGSVKKSMHWQQQQQREPEVVLSSKPMVHKRKRCTDLDMSKEESHSLKFKGKNTSAAAASPRPVVHVAAAAQAQAKTSSPLSPSSKAAVGRRYKLLSEVLC